MGIIGGIGVPELLIILVVVLLIFGPKNLPKLGASLGKTVKNIRKGMSAEDADVEDEDADVEEEEEAPKKKAAPRKRTTSTTARRAKKADEDADAE